MHTCPNIQIHVEDYPTLMPVLDRYKDNDRPAIMLYEVEPEDEFDDGLWCDLTINLPDYDLPGKNWAFVPIDKLVYLKALADQGLLIVSPIVRAYGSFDNRAYAVELSDKLVMKE